MEYALGAVVVLILLGVLSLLGRSGQVDSLRYRLGRLEKKVDLLLHHLGIDVPQDETWKELAREPAGKIRAIKAYREATGSGLKEAKDAVEQWMREQGL